MLDQSVASASSTTRARPAFVRSATRAGVYGVQPLSVRDTAAAGVATFAAASMRINGHATTIAQTAAAAAAKLHPRAAPPRNVRHAHSANAMISSVAKRRTTASLSTWAPMTQMSHATVAYSGNASACFKRVIHAPGRGRMRRHPGNHDNNRNGSAIPTPNATNTATVAALGCASAYPKAAPMNGAVQGDATITARTPDRRASA